jgi:hypothetical protein
MTESSPMTAPANWLHFRPEPVPSVSDRVVRALEAHVAAEAQDVSDCERVADSTNDPVVKLLLGMIVDDEKRHHSLLQMMINRLHEEVEFVASPSPLPTPGETTDFDPTMVAAVRSLIRDEHEGARHLRHLARQDAGLYAGLYALLLESVARDSEKHATILRYLLQRIEGSPR